MQTQLGEFTIEGLGQRANSLNNTHSLFVEDDEELFYEAYQDKEERKAVFKKKHRTHHRPDWEF